MARTRKKEVPAGRVLHSVDVESIEDVLDRQIIHAESQGDEVRLEWLLERKEEREMGKAISDADKKAEERKARLEARKARREAKKAEKEGKADPKADKAGKADKADKADKGEKAERRGYLVDEKSRPEELGSKLLYLPAKAKPSAPEEGNANYAFFKLLARTRKGGVAWGRFIRKLQIKEDGLKVVTEAMKALNKAHGIGIRESEDGLLSIHEERKPRK